VQNQNIETLADRLPHDADGLFDRISHFVEGLNDWSRRSVTSDAENYVNGNINLAFKYVSGRRTEFAKIGPQEGSSGPPDNISWILAEYRRSEEGEIGNLPLDDRTGDACIVSYWGQKPVLVSKVKLVNEPESLIPSRFTIRSEQLDCVKEPGAYPIGESLLYGGIEPCGGFAKGELDGPFLVLGASERGDNIPKRVIQGRAKIVDDIAANQGHSVYDGFVLFGERGALAGLCIRLKNVGEGALLCEKLDKLSDVFRGPLDFEI